MVNRIVKRSLGVAFVKGLQSSQQEGVEYRLYPLPGAERAPSPLVRMISWATLQRQCAAVRDCIAVLNGCASRSEPRGSECLEFAIDSLARQVLPETGLSELLASGGEPWLAIHDRYVSDLPWEGMRESFRFCVNENCSHFQRPLPREDATRSAPGFCRECGRVLRLKIQKLGTGRHLAHYVYGTAATPPPTGRRFLIVANPTGDLFDARLDPGGACSAHVVEIAGILKGAGYEVDILSASGATAAAFLEALRDPALCGLYYFGHGVHGEEAPEGALVFHGREILPAAEIEAERPRLQFAFLNACHGAAVGKDWGLDKPLRSVAHAFGQGGEGKVVIAPIWPIISTQAARAALDVFRAAVGQHSLSRCLRLARRRSYRRYKARQPDVAWASYRYFGDPERKLPAPSAPAPATPRMVDRLFDADGRLRVDLFSFPIDEVLLRAAKRRNFQQRIHVTPSDLLAGMLRRGELTRFALRAHQVDPDQQYESLVEAAEAEDRARVPAAAQAARAQSADDDTDRWILRARHDFRNDTLELLRRADEAAQQQGAEELLSELHLLSACCAASCWNSNHFVTLPKGPEILDLVQGAARRARLDDNGRILLDDLTPAARKVVEKAHAVAQIYGTIPITARLLLMAFLSDEAGAAAALVRTRQQVDAEGLAAILLALSEEQPSRTFLLGAEAASRIVEPVVQQARARAASGPIEELALFCAFCKAAPKEFKQLLEALPKPWQLSLDTLCDGPDQPPGGTPGGDQGPTPPGSATPGGVPLGGAGAAPAFSRDDLDNEVQLLLVTASHWARLQTSPEVRSPHLFAALVADGRGPVGIMLRRAGIDHEHGKIAILGMIPPPAQPAATPPQQVTLSASVLKALTAAVTQARRNGRRQCGLDDVLDAFFTDGGGAVGEQLRQLGVDTQLWKRRNWDQEGRRNGNGHKPSIEAAKRIRLSDLCDGTAALGTATREQLS